MKLIDDNGIKIKEGDILLSEYNYKVLVCKDGKDYYGALICEIGNSCRNIPYSLNGGKGYIKLIFAEKGIETANEIVKQGTVKTLDGVNYVLIEEKNGK